MIQSGIYQIKHRPTRKLYVGSAVDISRRWIGHRHELKKGKHHSIILQRAWNKYGESEFEFSILMLCESFELLRYEQHFIDTLKPFYNCAPKAGSQLGVRFSARAVENMSRARKGRVVTEETRAKIRAARLGTKRSPETIDKMRLARIGKPNPHAGVTKSAETKAKYSATMTGHVVTEETRAKLRAANAGQGKGRKLSQEVRDKMSATRKGKPIRRKKSPEQEPLL